MDAAVQEYGEAIRLNPNLAEGYYNLGLALQKQGQNEAAITAYRQALVVEPTMANAQYNLGLVLYQQGQNEDAIAAYQQSINLDSNNADAYFNLAMALQEQGDLIIIRTHMEDNNWVKISIIDNGPGIKEDICKKLYDPFFTTKEVGKGTGLGMAISYQIVTEKHGGTLECISALEQGSEFVVQIPRRQHQSNSLS